MEAERNVTSETNLEVDNTGKYLCHLLVKKKVYSLAQVQNMYDELRIELGQKYRYQKTIKAWNYNRNRNNM